jgi:MFS family permease
VTASGSAAGRLRRNREFVALTTAYTLSVAGDDLARIALAIVFYERTHSPFVASLTFALSFVPTLLAGPVLATLGDRFPRRDVMVVCDVARTLVVGLGAMALAFQWPIAVPLGLLLVGAFFGPAFEASRAALMPRVVSDDSYVAANVVTHVIGQCTQIAGYVVGGAVVIAVGGDGALLVDAATFAVSAILLVGYVRPGIPSDGEMPGRGPGLFAMMVRGGRDVLSQPALRGLLLVAGVTVAVAVAPEALAVVYATQHGMSGAVRGAFVAAVPAGTAVGGVVFTRWVPQARRARIIRPLAAALCVVLAATALPVGPAVVLALWFVAGVALAFQFVANATFVMLTPDGLRARAIGLAQAIMMSAQVAAILVAGALATSFDVRYVVAGVAALGLAAMARTLLRWPTALTWTHAATDSATPLVPPALAASDRS